MITPKSLHMISYKGMFLGTSNKVISFVNPVHAKTIRTFMTYENMGVRQVDPNTYSIEHPSNKTQKPLMRQNLALQTFDTQVGMYFAKVNNVELVLIDNVKQVNNKCYHMISNYDIEAEIDEGFLVYQMERLYHKDKKESIDYKEEYQQMLYVEQMLVNDEDLDI